MIFFLFMAFDTINLSIVLFSFYGSRDTDNATNAFTFAH